jgi:preprotein translocase subunit YajC
MTAYFWQILLFAQAAAEAPAGGGAAAPGAGPEAAPGISDGTRILFMVLVTGLLFYFIMLRPQKRKEQEMRERINNIKENERVITIGGIYGVVTNIQREQQRVTIRVDEATGTKIRVNMSAIARVLTSEDDEGATSGTKS